MKKLLLILLCFPMIGFGQNVNIPDANFKAYLVGNTAINTNGDAEIQVSEATVFNGSIISYNMNIADLTGIEEFSSLTSLNCSYNQLTSLDVAQNTSLTDLNCQYNQLTNLDVSNNLSLYSLVCSNNYLTSLDVAQNTALTDLYCYNNQLTNLDVSNNTALTNLHCQNNQLTSLDVAQNTALTNLKCQNNQIDSLDLNSIPIEYIECVNNNITYLNINNTALSNSNFGLFLNGNPFTTIIISNNQILYNLSSSLNNLTLENLQISNNPSLSYLTLEYMQVDTINVNNNTTLLDFNCYLNQISVLNVNNNPALTNLYCQNNQLTNLDVSNNSALTNLNCYDNYLTSLDVSTNTALTDLECGDNQLTSLDVAPNTALSTLSCKDNFISCLDVSVNLVLTNLNCSNNLIDQLNTKNGNWINNLYVNAMSNNLLCAEVDNIGYATNNWLFDSFTTLNTNCNYSNSCNMIYGCTDIIACNYDALATIDDGSCTYPVIWYQTPLLCDGDSIVVGSSVYDTAGNYIDTLSSANGCDSIVNTYLMAEQSTSSYDTLSVGASIVWNGMPLNVSGDYSVTLINSVGCDSIVNLNLTVTTTGISDITNTKINLVKITDMLGQETPYRRNTPLFYIYDDGTVEKRIVIE